MASGGRYRQAQPSGEYLRSWAWWARPCDDRMRAPSMVQCLRCGAWRGVGAAAATAHQCVTAANQRAIGNWEMLVNLVLDWWFADVSTAMAQLRRRAHALLRAGRPLRRAIYEAGHLEDWSNASVDAFVDEVRSFEES